MCLHLLRNTIKGNILIFRRTKFGVDKLEKTLLKNGYSANSIHGDKSQTARQEALNRFKAGEVNVLIATDVAARGLDVKDVGVVVNYDMPGGVNGVEDYVHRIGRTGRAGEKGIAISLVAAHEVVHVRHTPGFHH